MDFNKKYLQDVFMNVCTLPRSFHFRINYLQSDSEWTEASNLCFNFTSVICMSRKTPSTYKEKIKLTF